MAPVPESAHAVAVTGVILAGGQGLRMGGQDKAWLLWHDRPMVEHVRDRLLPQVSDLIVSANRNRDRYGAWCCRVVADDPMRTESAQGPLAGMASALAQATGPWVVFAPCDAPRLPIDLVSRLLDGPHDTRPRVPVAGGRWQPVFCALHRDVLDAISQALLSGERRPDRFLRTLGAVAVPFDDEAAFLNVNHPHQLEICSP